MTNTDSGSLHDGLRLYTYCSKESMIGAKSEDAKQHITATEIDGINKIRREIVEVM